MQKPLVLIILTVTAAMSFGAQAKQITRSCNFTVKVYGCASVTPTLNGPRCNVTSKGFLGSKSGSMSGTALTAYGARFEARKNVYFRTKEGSPLTVPVVNTHAYQTIKLVAYVSGDTGCKKDRSFDVDASIMPK